jgi:hypothetical protein
VIASIASPGGAVVFDHRDFGRASGAVESMGDADDPHGPLHSLGEHLEESALGVLEKPDPLVEPVAVGIVDAAVGADHPLEFITRTVVDDVLAGLRIHPDEFAIDGEPELLRVLVDDPCDGPVGLPLEPEVGVPHELHRTPAPIDGVQHAGFDRGPLLNAPEGRDDESVDPLGLLGLTFADEDLGAAREELSVSVLASREDCLGLVPLHDPVGFLAATGEIHQYRIRIADDRGPIQQHPHGVGERDDLFPDVLDF